MMDVCREEALLYITTHKTRELKLCLLCHYEDSKELSLCIKTLQSLLISSPESSKNTDYN